MQEQERDKLIIWGAVIVGGYFVVVKPLMGMLGSDPADTNLIEEQAMTNPADNPFSVQFQGFVDNFNANPSYDSNGNRMSMADVYHLIKNWYDFDDPNLTGKLKDIADWSESINDAFSFWTGGPDINKVLSVFSQLTNQNQVASIAAYFAYNFNKDLFHYLRYGKSISDWLPNGLSASELALLIKQINNLPE